MYKMMIISRGYTSVHEWSVLPKVLTLAAYNLYAGLRTRGGAL